jgi:ferredoxin, 2Fe-2S
MASVTYIEHNGTEYVIDVPVGTSVMQGAVQNGVEGIVAECGGGLACATCHCYVDAAWFAKLPAASEAEVQMLDSAANDRKSNSRLSCQINVTDELDGLIVRLPEKQY